MSGSAYEIAALTMRYVFAALMAWIALRAARGAIVDSRRAARLRRLSPMTGLCGEMVALEDGGPVRRGMRYPVIREGLIGASRFSDIRIRDRSVKARHAYFLRVKDGLWVRSHAGARLADEQGCVRREMLLQDGDIFFVGDVPLLLVLSEPGSQPRPAADPGPMEDGRQSGPTRTEAAPDDFRDDFSDGFDSDGDFSDGAAGTAADETGDGFSDARVRQDASPARRTRPGVGRETAVRSRPGRVRTARGRYAVDEADAPQPPDPYDAPEDAAGDPDDLFYPEHHTKDGRMP